MAHVRELVRSPPAPTRGLPTFPDAPRPGPDCSASLSPSPTARSGGHEHCPLPRSANLPPTGATDVSFRGRATTDPRPGAEDV